MPAEIWLGDMVRTVRALGFSAPDELATIASLLLGFEQPQVREHVVQPKPKALKAAYLPPPRQLIVDKSVLAPSPKKISQPPAHKPSTAPAGSAQVTVEQAGQSPATEMKQWLDVRPLAMPEKRHRMARPDHISLLSPDSERSILHAMLSRMVPDGPVDVLGLVDTLARGRPVLRLPRTRVPTSRFGVQVLIDLGRRMELFLRDQEAVAAQVKAVIGTHSTEIRYFAMNPMRGSTDDIEARWQPYKPPAAGCRVLLLSDLGLGAQSLDRDRSKPGEWIQFVDLLRRHGCSAVGLVPFPASQWPSWLIKLLPLVSWDRCTMASAVRARSSWE